MKEEQIIEGNKAIAEFMGAKKSNVDNDNRYLRFKEPHAGTSTYAFYPKEMKYHTSWDWLMRACKKFDTLSISLRAKRRLVDYQRHCDAIDNAVTLYEIQPAFEALVSAVQWYNTQNKK